MARTARTHRLTALAVRKYANDLHLTAPLHDGGGLYLRKRGAASLTWVLRLTDPANGSQQWHRLFPDNPTGTYPTKSPAEARKEALRLWTIRSGGIDPRGERRRDIEAWQTAESSRRAALEGRVTIRALFDRWEAIDLSPRRTADGRRLGRKDGGSALRGQFEQRVFPGLGSSAVEDVRRGDLLALLDVAKAEGKLRTANVLLSSLKQMFRFALARDIVQRNPLDTVSKRDVGGPSVERDRVLSICEVCALSAALPSLGLQARFAAGVWLILSTGVRVGGLLGAVRADAVQDADNLRPIGEQADVKVGFVDLAGRTWHIPVTKNQRSHTIHLSDFAWAQFMQLKALGKARRDITALSPWVFSNDAGDGPVGVKTLGKQLSDRQRGDRSRLPGRSKARTSLALPGGAGPRMTCAERRQHSWPRWASVGT